MDWFDQEPPLAAAGWRITRRLARRAAASWPVWLAAALLVAGVSTVRRARAPIPYEASVLMRVTEGEVSIRGAQLGAGALRAHLNEIVFTNRRLLKLIRRHPGRFPDPEQDPASALEALRDNLTVTVSDNDFTEDRRAEDPARSARLKVTFAATDPALAHGIAREVAEMVKGATVERQQESLEQQRVAAQTAVNKAEADLAELARTDPLMLDARTRSARDRANEVKQDLNRAKLALHALGEQQAVRFEVVDPGRVPPRRDTRGALLTSFLVTLLSLLAAGVLLAGAFDPRVLDGQDLESMGRRVLGRLPALPAARAAR